MVDKESVSHKVHPCRASLLESWPFGNERFDLVLDSYVLCHVIRDEQRRRYLDEMRRVLKPGGYFFSSGFSTDDAYYRGLIRSDSPIVTDPHNGVSKRLYTPADLKLTLATGMDLRYFTQFEFEDIVLEKPYWRAILVAILTKSH